MSRRTPFRPLWPVAALCAIIAAAAFALTSPIVLAQAAPIPAEVSAVLARAGGGATPDDVTTLLAGRVVARTEVAPEHLEASVIAAVRIATGLERTVSYFRQLVAYVDGQTTLQDGTFTQPAEEADVRALTLEPGDLVDLRTCQATHCEMRVIGMSADSIQSAVDWTATNAAERGGSWLRRAFVSALNSYQRAGDASLRGYDDRGAALDFQDLWRGLEQGSPIPAVVAPGLLRYLGTYPGAMPGEASNEFYWDKQHFSGLKPVTGITHLITWRDSAQPHRVVIAQKQIQSTHYFFGSLAVTLFVQDTATPPATYVVYTNRTRGDILRGTQASTQTGIRGRVSSIGASVQRRLGEQLVRQSAETLMNSMKQALER